VLSAARLDLDIKLADLQRRSIQFRHLLATNPALLRGGIWQLVALPVAEEESAEMLRTQPEYRKLSERVRQLTEELRLHSQFDMLRRSQVRLWKTPQYREIHRRYMGRMQDLQRLYNHQATAGGGQPSGGN
jgi:hypothetical protein